MRSRMTWRGTALLAWMWALLLITCGKHRHQPAIAPGPLRADRISFELAVYYPTPPKGDPLADLDRLLAAEHPGLKRSTGAAPAASETAPTVTARLKNDVPSSYPPPGVDILRYHSHGLDTAQGEALQHSQQALILDFAHGRDHVWQGLRTAMQVAGAMARSSGGFVWDEETREVFTPES